MSSGRVASGGFGARIVGTLWMIGLLACPSHAWTAEIEATANPTSWEVVPGASVDIVARIENHGASPVFLNGLSWTLDPDRTWTVDTGAFVVSGPARLAPYQVWSGTVAHIEVPLDASAGQTLVDLAVLGGAAEDETTPLCTVTARVFVNLPACAPAITRPPSDTLVQVGHALNWSINVSGGSGVALQWMKDGVDLSDSETLIGSQAATLQLLAPAPNDGGFYTVRVTNACGEVLSPPAHLIVQDLTGTPVDLPPRVLAIESVAPNPAGASSVIRWTVPARTSARLEVFDATGRLRRTLLKREVPAGRYWTPWDGRDDRGQQLPAGVYFVRLDADRRSLTRKVVFIR